MPDDLNNTAQPGQGEQPPASQQPGDATEAADTVSRSELEKVIAERQAAKDRARQVETEMTTLQQQLADLKGQVLPQEDLDMLAEIKAKQAEDDRSKALAEGDADAIAQAAIAPYEQRIAGLTERIGQREQQLTEMMLNNALLSAAQRAGAINPDQVVTLLRHRVTMKEDHSGQFVPAFVDESGTPVHAIGGEKTTADSFVSAFLSKPENANLVAATTNPGSGAKPGGGKPNPDGLPTTREQFEALPEDQRMQVAMKMTTAQRNNLFGIASPADGGAFM